MKHRKESVFALSLKDFSKLARNELGSTDTVGLFYKTYNSIKKAIENLKHQELFRFHKKKNILSL